MKSFWSISFSFSCLLFLFTIFTIVSVEITADEIVKDCSCSKTRKQLNKFLQNLPSEDVQRFSEGSTEIGKNTHFKSYVELKNNASVSISSAVATFDKLIVLFDDAQLIFQENSEIKLSPKYETKHHLFDETNILLFDRSSIVIEGNNTKWQVITAQEQQQKRQAEDFNEANDVMSSSVPQGKAVLLCEHSSFEINSATLGFPSASKDGAQHALQGFIVKDQAELNIKDLKPDISNSLKTIFVSITQSDNSDVTLDANSKQQELKYILEYLLPKDKTNKKSPFVAYPTIPNENPDLFSYSSDDGTIHFCTEVNGGITIDTVAVDLAEKNNLTLEASSDTAFNVFCTFKNGHGVPSSISQLRPSGILQGRSITLGDRSLIVKESNDTKDSANILSWDLKFVDVKDKISITDSEIHYLNVTQSQIDIDKTDIIALNDNGLHFTIDGTISMKPQMTLLEHSIVKVTGESIVAANIDLHYYSYLSLGQDVRFCKSNDVDKDKHPYQLSASHKSFVYVFPEETGCSESKPIMDVYTSHSFVVQHLINTPDPSMLNSSDPFNVTGIARVFAPQIDATNFTVNFTFANPDAFDEEVKDMHTSDNYSTTATPHPLSFDDFEVLYTPEKEMLCGNWTMNITMSGDLPFPLPTTDEDYFESLITKNFFEPKPHCRKYRRGLAFAIVGITVGVTLIVALGSISAAVLYHRWKIRREQFYERIQ